MDPLTVLAQPPSTSAPATKRLDARVCLIRPARISSAYSYTFDASYPLGIAYLASYLEKVGATVEIVDAIGEGLEQVTLYGDISYHGLSIEEITQRISAGVDVIGVSCMFSQEWPWTRELIKSIRKRFPDTLIIAGGEHVSAITEYCLNDCPEIDICAIGEGEETLREIVTAHVQGGDIYSVNAVGYMKEGKYHATPSRARVRDVDQIPWPAYHLVNVENHMNYKFNTGIDIGRRVIAMLATRGCPYRCTFCTNPFMYGTSYYPRDAKDVVDEMESYVKEYGANDFHFYDLTLTTKRSWVLELCNEIIDRGLKVTFQLPAGTRSEVIDDEVASALKRSGCAVLSFAAESGDTKLLQELKKKVDLDHLKEACKASLRQDVRVRFHLVVGFPNETRLGIAKSMVLAWKLALVGAHDVVISNYTPFPGGEIFYGMIEDGTIPQIDDEYLKSLSVANPLTMKMYCKHMSGREIRYWRLWTYASFFIVQYLRRPWRFARLVKEIYQGTYTTYHSQHFGRAFRRWFGKKEEKPDNLRVAQEASAMAQT